MLQLYAIIVLTNISTPNLYDQHNHCLCKRCGLTVLQSPLGVWKCAVQSSSDCNIRRLLALTVMQVSRLAKGYRDRLVRCCRLLAGQEWTSNVSQQWARSRLVLGQQQFCNRVVSQQRASNMFVVGAYQASSLQSSGCATAIVLERKIPKSH